jgi:CRP-like cAMP-binding protein
MDTLKYLTQINFFEGLTKEEYDLMERKMSVIPVDKGQLIYSPGMAEEGLFLIKEGSLKIYSINVEGKPFIVSILGPGNIIGEVDSFSFGTKHFFIETLEKTLLCAVTKEEFEQFLIMRPHIALGIMKEMSSVINERNALVLNLAYGDVQIKTMTLLMNLARRFGINEGTFHRIDIPLTQQDLGNMIGSTRETITVALKELVYRQLIKTSRRTIYINMDRAQQFLENQ